MITHKDMRKYLLAHDLPTNTFGNATFFALVEYVTPLRKCNVETLVSFVLAGYCEGTIRLDPSDDLTQIDYMVNFTCAWHECKFDLVTSSFVIRGSDPGKMGGDFVVRIRQA